MRLSVVVTAYNRRDLVVEAIDSVRPWLQGSVDTEIIVVDDASNDGTITYLESRYAQDIARGRMRLIPLERNRGATGAKNAGVFAARGDWIVFVDSDDLLLPNSQSIITGAIASHPERVLLFFRCVTLENGQLVGAPADGWTEIRTRDHVNGWRFGECMGVVRRDVFMAIPFDEDLRGFEGFTWMKIARRYGPSLVCHQATRRYRQSNQDRLCASPMLRKRACLMARGHARMLRHMHKDYGIRAVCGGLGKVFAYGFYCTMNKLRPRTRSSGWNLTFGARV